MTEVRVALRVSSSADPRGFVPNIDFWVTQISRVRVKKHRQRNPKKGGILPACYKFVNKIYGYR